MDDKLLSILVNNKYRLWYLSICRKRKVEPLTYDSRLHHKHHILPKCMGGDHSQSNLVVLTHREHFIAHRCLAKCTVGEDKRRMKFAAWIMVWRFRKNNTKITNRTYASLHQEYRESRKGIKPAKLTEDGRRRLSEFGKKNKGRVKTATVRKNMSGPKSDKHKENIRKSVAAFWAKRKASGLTGQLGR